MPNTSLEITRSGGSSISTPASPVSVAQPQAAATGPTGVWPIFPGVLSVGWNVDEINKDANIEILIFGFKWDQLSGVIGSGGTIVSVSDDLSLIVPIINYVILTADATVSVDGVGIRFDADLTFHGQRFSFDTYLHRWS